jgi:WhiB family redox-sensing transcriptional regulator
MTRDALDDLFAIAADQPWMDQARCAGSDPDLWHPKNNDAAQAKQAKRICRRCPVRAECLAYALEHGEEHGVWGGMSVRERERLRREERAA